MRHALDSLDGGQEALVPTSETVAEEELVKVYDLLPNLRQPNQGLVLAVHATAQHVVVDGDVAIAVFCTAARAVAYHARHEHGDTGRSTPELGALSIRGLFSPGGNSARSSEKSPFARDAISRHAR